MPASTKRRANFLSFASGKVVDNDEPAISLDFAFRAEDSSVFSTNTVCKCSHVECRSLRRHSSICVRILGYIDDLVIADIVVPFIDATAIPRSDFNLLD